MKKPNHRCQRVASVLPRLALLATLLAACTPPQRIYSTSPVDRYGQPLPLEQVLVLIFEDSTELGVPAEKSLVLVDGSFELIDRRGYTDEESPSWRVSQVAEVRWRTPEGNVETAEVKTPDDLRDYDRLPRVYRIEVSDGRTISLGQTPQEPTWSANGLELEITHDDGQTESIPLEDIETIVLHDSSVLKSTLGSWKFWAATGAGVVLFLWISDEASKQDNATE